MSDIGEKLGKITDPGDFFGAQSAREGIDVQRESSAAQLGETRRQFDIGQERLEPFFEQAVPAFELQAALSGAQGPEPQKLAFEQFQASPGTEFATEQGLRLINSQGGATGGAGGDRLRELTKFSQGLALQDLSNQFNRLGVVSGAGQTAATQQAQLGANFAGRTSEILQNEAQGIQAGISGQQQARANLAGTAVGVAGLFAKAAPAAAAASDRDIKTDIHDISNEDCFNHVMSTPMFVWRYLEEAGIDTDLHIGPMYQESPDCIKMEGMKALNIHDELWLIAGAIKHLAERENGTTISNH